MVLGLEYWIVPILSAVVWTAMLVTMFVYWAATGRPHYVSMYEGQHIPYISNIGAEKLKPMFIAMSAVTVVSFDLVFIFERWLRHSGRLTRNTSVWQKVYSACATIAAIVGAAGLILLSIFDVKRHKHLHDTFLGVFIGGYIISAIFICWEYQRLGIHYREHSVLRASFWMKLFFILAELALAIGFGVTGRKKLYNAAAILEWIIAFLFGFYVISYVIDFLPALRTKHHHSEETEMQAAEEGGRTDRGDGAAESQQYFRGNAAPTGTANGYTNGHTNGHTNGYTNGTTTNGHTHGNANGYATCNEYTDANVYTNGNVSHDSNGYPKPATPPLPSRNF